MSKENLMCFFIYSIRMHQFNLSCIFTFTILVMQSVMTNVCVCTSEKIMLHTQLD